MPSLWGVLSETSYIISSSLLHFATLYLIFVLDKSQLLYGLALLTFNISFVSSVTTTIFCGFHRKPIKLYTSLRSPLSFFLPDPVLLCKLAYSIILVAILSALGIFTGLVFYVMILLGLEIEATASTCFTALVFTTMILFAVLFAYLCVEWCFMDDAVVVVEEEESKYGVEGSVVTGMRSVAFVVITMLGILQGILSAVFSVLAGRGRASHAVLPQLLGYAALFAVLSLFCLVHCKAFNGEFEDLGYFNSVEKKLRQIQLSRDYVGDKV